METRIVFGVKYKTTKTVEAEAGFWFWKKKILNTVDSVKTAYYVKDQYVPSSITQIEIPVFGETKIRERTICQDGVVEVWLGNHGFWLEGWDFEYLSDQAFQKLDEEIKSFGFVRR